MLDERVVFLVKLALAAGIGLLVLQYSRRGDRLIGRHADDVGLMLKRSEREEQVHVIRARRALYSDMQAVAHICSTLAETSGGPPDMTAPQWESFKSNVAGLHSRAGRRLVSLDRNLESFGHLDDSTYDKIRNAVDMWDEKARIDDDSRTVNVLQYREMMDVLNLALPVLERRQGPGTGVALAQFRPTEATSQSDRLAISLDRDTYPPGAVIHVSLTAVEPLPDRKVTVTILDMGLKILAQKKAAAPGQAKLPAALLRALVGPRSCRKSPVGQGSGGAAAPAVVDMALKGAAEGGWYMVRAACGGLISEAAFDIESAPPVVQTNKSEFLMGEDMIVTVIDPVANKDGSKRDFAGASGRSRLVIDSPHGRIDGYRLKETGSSTGVFQGRVRIIGVRNDGSVVGTEIGGTHIAKTQGRGEQDGAITCGPGQAIHIRYTNGIESGAVTVLGARVAPTVELDREEYACLDRVEICVIVPRVAGGEAAAPAIGDSRQDCWVSISSGEGTIDGYRLTETGPESGIFTGAVSLTGHASMGDGELPKGVQYGETDGAGPHGGKLACRSDDTVTVRVTSAFAEPVGATARICPRAGMPGRK